jgi:hypothetical protein
MLYNINIEIFMQNTNKKLLIIIKLTNKFYQKNII